MDKFLLFIVFPIILLLPLLAAENINFFTRNRKKIVFDSLDDADFYNSDFTGITFENLSIKNSSFVKVNLTNCAFINCDLTNADFTEAIFNNTQFKNCELKGVKIEDAVKIIPDNYLIYGSNDFN